MIRRPLGDSELQFKCVERQLYRLRDKKYPKHPRTNDEIRNEMKKPEIVEHFGRNMSKQVKFYIGSEVKTLFAFHVFASMKVVNFIKKNIACEDRKYLIDGTFKVVPQKFAQLLVISIEYKNNVR